MILLKFKMYKINSKFLLAGDNSMPELHLILPEFTYSACGLFTKHHRRIKKFRETCDLKHRLDYIKLVLLVMLHILIVKIQLRDLFRQGFER